MADQHFDLIIIGGGILGTFHAYHALQEGKTVLQLEKDNYPVGATVRNFGQAVPSGMEAEWFEYGARGLEIYQSIQEEYDISVRKNGSVYIASDEDEQTLIHELKAHYDTLGYTAELLSKESIHAKYPSIKASYAKEALYFPQEISVEPGLMIYNLHQYMQSKFETYTLRYNNPVIDCVSKGSGVEVKTSLGITYRAEKAIICNGYEFKLLYPELFSSSGIVISKLQMMRSVPMPEVQLEGNILTGLTIRRYESFEHYCPSFQSIKTPEHYEELKKWGIHILFKKAADNSIIIGDSHIYAEVNQFDQLGFDLDQHVNELMLKEAERIADFNVRDLQSTWAGFYPQHPTHHIVEYDLDNRIHIRTAIGGKGMTASAGYAEQSIRKILS
ncbi:TIGR03364 family FAD-dependent oxidoreductase [Pedobacter sp. HMWF019]|uniref:TIGR03364 family FAD-dependent oxidoreductase n=1 Tax=Pedobacter sp. HMWF019 TaxID=2056856 RepID=UPI000D3ACD1C|nr:TIGR03364 family FAD-dependent oxidoreductase [Pedobacter sp. HMWF019]PTS99498.1 TIGR03364 family FAD-dependent oxidoreductase [Pedobacter sp. HMWF019]